MEVLTRIVPAFSAINEAVALLRAGDLVAFPTETVFGLGADARSDTAIAKIYAAKGRPSGNPVIVHVATPEDAPSCTTDWPANAAALARAFWPGPLTLILPRGPALSPLVSAGRTTVALRCPHHVVATALLRAFAGPIAAPSANRSGFTSPTTAQHVFAELAGRIPLILDSPEHPCTIGLESTVLDLSSGRPTVLRPGAVTLDMLHPILPDVQLAAHTVATTDAAISPGLHSRHYAPRTPAYRFDANQWPLVLQFTSVRAPVVVITYSSDMALPAPHHTIQLPADDRAYARALYAALRDGDELNANAILVACPPGTTGLWTAIADRLRRATLPLPNQSPDSR
jgi:L-threonylcarbamoyladenylate synthase